MTSKEKAIEIVERFYLVFGDGYLGGLNIQCALISLSEEYNSLCNQLFNFRSSGIISNDIAYLSIIDRLNKE